MSDVLRNTLMITGFVFVMMLVIEYVNVLTSGVWRNRIAGSTFGQYLMAAVLGAIPGCLGSFAVVAMYSHRVIGIGAVVTAMIATSGDETFVMLALIPRQTLVLTIILFAAGIAAGMLTDLLSGSFRKTAADSCDGLIIHAGQDGSIFLRGKVAYQLKHCTAVRGILAITLIGLIIGVSTGGIGHHGDGGSEGASIRTESAETGTEPPFSGGAGGHVHEWGWIKITMIVSSLAALFIVATVSDHFLEEHLWEHIARRHLVRVFLWTFGALFVLYLLTERLHVDLESLAGERLWVVLAIACLVGLIPQSGPHLVFVTLFAEGVVPFSILLANSAVQDGHGMLPMLAHSRRDFILVKGINFLAGLILGAAVLLSGH